MRTANGAIAITTASGAASPCDTLLSRTGQSMNINFSYGIRTHTELPVRELVLGTYLFLICDSLMDFVLVFTIFLRSLEKIQSKLHDLVLGAFPQRSEQI